MITLVSVTLQSIAKEPIRHVPNAVLGAGGAYVAPYDWLAIAVGVTSILTGFFIIFKTYQDIHLNCLKITAATKRNKKKKS